MGAGIRFDLDVIKDINHRAMQRKKQKQEFVQQREEQERIKQEEEALAEKIALQQYKAENGEDTDDSADLFQLRKGEVSEKVDGFL